MDEKISAMPAAVAVGATDVIPIVQGGVNKTVTGAVLATCIGLPQSYAAPGGTNPTGILTARGATDFAINTTDGSFYLFFNGAWSL